MERIQLADALYSSNTVPVLACAIVLAYVVYQRLLAPLAFAPGPALASLTNIWYAWTVHKGNMHETLPALHHKYGPIVRIAPNELYVSHSHSWKTCAQVVFQDHLRPRGSEAHLRSVFMYIA
jgi:hypothetical protein